MACYTDTVEETETYFIWYGIIKLFIKALFVIVV